MELVGWFQWDALKGRLSLSVEYSIAKVRGFCSFGILCFIELLGVPWGVVD